MYLCEILIQMDNQVMMSWCLQFLYPNIHTAGFPWPLPAFPSSGSWCHQQSCCSPWLHTSMCTQIHTHTYMRLPLLLCPRSKQLIAHFHVSPHLGTSSHHSLTPLNHALSLRHAWEEAGMWGRNKGLQILYFLRGFCHAGDVRGAVSFPFSWGAVTMTMAILVLVSTS